MDIRDAELAGSYNEFIIIILQIQHAVQMDMPLPTAASIPRDEQDKCLGKKKEVHGDWLSAYAFSVFEYRVA
jgi:hypothetical protein